MDECFLLVAFGRWCPAEPKRLLRTEEKKEHREQKEHCPPTPSAAWLASERAILTLKIAMSGEDDEAVQAIVDDIMDKTSGTEDIEQPTQASNLTSNEQQQQNATTQKLQQQRVEAVQRQHLPKNETESASPSLANPLSVCSGSRRSTSADSERSLRLEIAESSGGGTSGAESPLAMPILDKSGCVTPTNATYRGAPNTNGGNVQPNCEDKTPIANPTEDMANKAKDGGGHIAEDDVQKEQPNPMAEKGTVPTVVESNSVKEHDGEAIGIAPGEPTDSVAPMAPPSAATSPAPPKTPASADDVSSSAPNSTGAAAIILSSSAPSTSSTTMPQTNPSQSDTTDENGTQTAVVVPLVSSGVTSTTTSSASIVTTSAAVVAPSSSPPTLASSGGISGTSTIVTVSIAGKSAASITAAAAAAAAARSTGASATAPAPPTLALMRAPIQPKPVTRILPRPTAKKTQQVNSTAVTTTTTANANCPTWTAATTTMSTVANISGTTMAIAAKPGAPKSGLLGTGGAPVRGQLTSGSTMVFSGAKTVTTATNAVQQHNQKILANGTISSATTKFAAVVPQRVGSVVAPLTPPIEAKEPQREYTTKMSASSLDKFADTVNRVAAGTEISPPHPSMQQQIVVAYSSAATATTFASSTAILTTTTTASSTAAAIQPPIATMAKGQPPQLSTERGQQMLKPKAPKKKKAPAAPKAKNGATNGIDEGTEQRNTTTISVVDMQQQQQQLQQSSSTASLFPLCPSVSSNAPGGGMLFPSNFALAATPNGTVGASLMAAYPNGGASGGITQYFIRQTTSSGHQQLIPVIPSQQQFFFSPMPEAVDPNNAIATNGPPTAAHFQGQTSDDQQQRMVIQQQQQQQQHQVRNLYFRSGNELIMPAMVSNSVVSGANVSLTSSAVPSSQHSAVAQANFVASTTQHHRPQQKGTFVGIHPKGGMPPTAVAARTAIAPKGSQQQTTGEGPSSAHQPVSTPVVMIGGPSHHSPYQQQLAPSQQQYFLTPSGAIVTLQAPPPHQLQPQQQHIPTIGNVRIMPQSSNSSTPMAIASGDVEQYMQKNGMVGSTPNSSRPNAAVKVSSPKRKRKTDSKDIPANSATFLPTDQDPTKHFSQQQHMADYPLAVDEEENEPPPVLCRVFNRSEDEPIVSTQSVESVFQHEAKIIRERIYDASGKKFGPLKHFIDGFEIEEDIEPFPCEHQQLLDKLKREQAALEAEAGGEVQKETAATKSGTLSPEKNAEMDVQDALRRKTRKRAATASSSVSSASSPTRSPKRSNAMDTCDRMEDESPPAINLNESNSLSHRHLAEEANASVAGDSATESATTAAAAALLVKKGRRRELDGLLKMDFGKHSPFQTSDPDKYAKEVLIEARQQQRTLALAQEEQRNVRRSVESSCGGSATGKSSKRDKYAKKPFSPPVSPLPESRAASVRSTTPTQPLRAKNNGEKASSWSSKLATTSGMGKPTKEGTTTTPVENKLKTSPKDSFSLEQRRSGGSNVSEEGEERCLYCRRSFKEVPRDKDHVQYCSKACRKQLKAAKRMKHSGGSLEDGLNSSTGMAGDEPRSGVVSATPSHRRSDPSSSSDSSGQQQQSTCHITSPLGSAFSAMQPQMLSKRRLPVDQHAEQLMSLNQRLSGNNGAGLAASFAPTPYGQSPPDQNPAMLAVPMAIRPTSGAPPTMIQYGTTTAMYFNAPAQQHQIMVSSSGASSSAEQQQAAAVHAYQQQQQQHHHEQQMLYATGTMAGGSQQQQPQQQQQHFFPPQGGPSGAAHPGTPSPFLPPSMARQPSLTTTAAPSSSPATPVSTPTNFLERNADIDALVARGVHTWTKEEVSKWVNFVTGSDTNGDRFVEEDVDGASLLCLQSEQLKTELKFKLGPHIKIWSALEALKRTMMC
ncbi:hypothetical protein niasHS_015911 [Heterodera schachtii]|uniref:SAM domain-containing protein n=1 Tax=Heterodera schachtii TaxID=97005 RepID=A0ABD2HW06_HETSC